jgi:hypothetical protein
MMSKVTEPSGTEKKKPFTRAPETTTIKISRFLREYIAICAEWGESIDETIVRYLPKGKKSVSKAPFDQVEKAQKNAAKSELPPTTTVKIARTTFARVIERAQWNRSIDGTLRLLFGLPADEKTEKAEKVEKASK